MIDLEQLGSYPILWLKKTLCLMAVALFGDPSTLNTGLGGIL
ncbi:uncharacterized protein FIBRA_09505 [Fibroporia radiculosa]|uniref:Uncharacterized protein n=1 Tax=Fibroporia radiculosa TaxID=599839 RepID=J7SCH6_9APHY|nr:uncharacterized protein FIBRA_09505 [Fibroporia radiculosa]CCM07166.1 predicted protein [Fibroporia radiculosa]